MNTYKYIYRRAINHYCYYAIQPRRIKIDRSMIGEPTNFVHTHHMGSGDTHDYAKVRPRPPPPLLRFSAITPAHTAVGKPADEDVI